MSLQPRTSCRTHSSSSSAAAKAAAPPAAATLPRSKSALAVLRSGSVTRPWPCRRWKILLRAARIRPRAASWRPPLRASSRTPRRASVAVCPRASFRPPALMTRPSSSSSVNGSSSSRGASCGKLADAAAQFVSEAAGATCSTRAPRKAAPGTRTSGCRREHRQAPAPARTRSIFSKACFATARTILVSKEVAPAPSLSPPPEAAAAGEAAPARNSPRSPQQAASPFMASSRTQLPTSPRLSIV